MSSSLGFPVSLNWNSSMVSYRSNSVISRAKSLVLLLLYFLFITLQAVIKYFYIKCKATSRRFHYLLWLAGSISNLTQVSPSRIDSLAAPLCNTIDLLVWVKSSPWKVILAYRSWISVNRQMGGDRYKYCPCWWRGMWWWRKSFSKNISHTHNPTLKTNKPKR